MRWTRLRRLLTGSILLLTLVALAGAMVVAWTANQREWYVDGAGFSATLNMNLSETARQIAISALAMLAVLTLAALVMSQIGGTQERSHPASVMPPVTGRTFAYGASRPTWRDPAPPEEVTLDRSRRGRIAATVVGDRSTQRMEQSLPAWGSAGFRHGERVPTAAGPRPPGRS